VLIDQGASVKAVQKHLGTRRRRHARHVRAPVAGRRGHHQAGARCRTGGDCVTVVSRWRGDGWRV